MLVKSAILATAALGIGASMLLSPTVPVTIAAPAHASPAPGPMLSRSGEQPEGACIYRSPTPTSPLKMCIDTTEDWCGRHVGGFVFGTFFEGETCDDLKARGAY